MTSIDDLFKSRLASRPAPSTSNNKRKLTSDPTTTPAKAARTSFNGDAKGGQHVTVEDDAEDAGAAENDEGDEAGPDLPPGVSEGVDEDEDEDEEGRFFGGGVTQNTADALDYLDDPANARTAPDERIDTAWLKRTSLNFEKLISRNAEQRTKHADDPQKFMSSEADLDADIKALSILSEHAELYPDFARLGCVGSLVGLLAHENTDIAINAIEILAELSDQDVPSTPEQFNALVEAAVEADLPDLLIQNFARLDEEEEADRAGVYHSLSLLENLLSHPPTAETILRSEVREQLLEWLDKRVDRVEKRISQNKAYAAEVLAITMQTSHAARASYIQRDGIDHTLQRLAPYRKHDPQRDSEGEEFVENSFDALAALVDTNAGKAALRDAEGIELMLIMVREGGKLCKPRAMGVLDHALSRATATTTDKAPADDDESMRAEPARLCEAFVDAAGLKPLFSNLMRSSEAALTEHALGMLASLLRALPGASAGRIRTLAKCVEKQYQVVARLIRLRREYGTKLSRVGAEIATERQAATEEDVEEMEAEWLSRRLDAGLFSFQTIDVILAWLVAEDGGARAELVRSFRGEGSRESLEDVRATLSEQLDGLEGSSNTDDVEAVDMLRTLIELLE